MVVGVSDVDNVNAKFLVPPTTLNAASNENAVLLPTVAPLGVGTKQLLLSFLTTRVSKSIPL